MQQAQLRRDPIATGRLGSLSRLKARPSEFPEPEDRAPRKACKVRPLDHLSRDERRAAACLEHGGREAEIVRKSARGPARRWWWEPDACAYQVWLFDHRPEVAP